MSTQHPGEQVPPTFEWLVDELRQRVTTMEIELAHWEHANTPSPDHADPPRLPARTMNHRSGR